MWAANVWHKAPDCPDSEKGCHFTVHFPLHSTPRTEWFLQGLHAPCCHVISALADRVPSKEILDGREQCFGLLGAILLEDYVPVVTS